MKPLYLDYAAATPVSTRVLTAMQPYFAEKFYNPSALYLSAKGVADDLKEARGQVAQCLGARPGEIIFTAGGTEANNLAIHGVMQQFPQARILVSAVEHESVLKPAEQYNHQEIPVDGFGAVLPEKLEEMIDEQTVLISVMMANNEIGTIQPIARIAALVQQVRHQRLLDGNTLPLYVHTDACQAANYLNLKNSGVDLMTLNGGKIYGPKQSGILYVRAGVELHAQVLGGGQEFGLRSGTENVPAAIGFAEALSETTAKRPGEVKRLTALQELFCDLIIEKIPGAIINGTAQHALEKNPSDKQLKHAVRSGQRLPNNIHITIPGHDNERLLFALDEAGVQCATGSACSASSEEPSHVLRAIGLSDEDVRASLRFTMGRRTDETSIREAVERLAAALRAYSL